MKLFDAAGTELAVADQGAAVERLFRTVTAVTPWTLPLLRASYLDGRINYAHLNRGVKLPKFVLTAKKPTVVLVGDDDHASSGPAGFPNAKRLAKWACAVIIHGAGGETWHYEEAVAGALARHRLALVETSSRHANEWLALFGNGKTIPALVILPEDGEHPVLPEKLQ